MIHTWKSTHKESMGKFFARTIKNEHDLDIFIMLWESFRINYIIQSPFFESIRVGDNKYNLWIHREKNEILTVQFTTT